MAGQLERTYLGYDLETAVTENSFDKVREYTETIIEFFSKLVHYEDFAKLKTELAYEQRINEWLIQKYLSEKSIDFSAGYYIGLLATFQEHLNNHHQSERIKKVSDSFPAVDLPHINEILFAIEKQEGIRHGKLAEAVGIEKSTLSGIMDKAVGLGVVTFSRPGKFKYYYLTKTGQDYCNQHREEFNHAKSLDSVLEELLEIVEHAENPEQVVVDIFKSLYVQRKSPKQRKNRSRRNAAIALAQMISEAKPRVSLSSDLSNTCYRINDVQVLSSIFEQEEELIFKTNEIQRNVNWGYAITQGVRK